MKKLVALLLVVMMLLTQVCVMAEPAGDMEGGISGAPTSLKILAIGNSFSADSMQWLYDILNDMGVKEVILGNMVIGGCSLETHAKNATENLDKYTYHKCSKDTEGKWVKESKKTLEYGLKDEEWDYISIQQVSGKAGLISSYEPYLSQLIDYVKANATNPNAKLMWNMTWAYQKDNTHADYPRYGKSQEVMYRAVVNAVQTHIVPNENIDYIIPCGTAVQNMRTSQFGDTLTRDGYHMNMIYGRYLVGTMWAKVITGASLDSLTHLPGEDGEITPLMLDVIKESVEKAFEKPFEVTNSTYKTVGDNTDYANLIANCFVDVTDQGTYDEATGIFTFNDGGTVARNSVDIAYLGTKAASLDGQVCAAVDGRFYVPQVFLDCRDGKKEFSPLVSETFDVEMFVEKNGEKWQGRVDVTNYLTGYETTGTVKFTAPEMMKDVSVDIKSADGMTSSAIFDIPEIKTEDNYYNFAFDFVTEGKTYSYDVTKEISFAKKAYGIAVDGIMSEGEWDNAYVMVCDKADQALNLTDWAGASDINAKTYIAWDEENFYLCGEVEDNNFTGPAKESLPWEGDSIQFALYHDSNNNFVPGDSAKGFHEVAISLFDGKASVYKSKAQTGDTKTGLIENANAAVVNNGTKTVYEFSIKWSDLLGYDYAPQADDILGFSILYNDNDGNGRRGWIEYGGGIGGTKDANEFAQLYLTGVNDVSIGEIRVYVNGKRLSFDQPPVFVDDRTLVPLRAIFEALGATVDWDDETWTVTAVRDDVTISLKIGEKTMYVNGEEITLDVPAQLMNTRTLVPLRAISEAFGCTVEWEDKTQTVTITE